MNVVIPMHKDRFGSVRKLSSLIGEAFLTIYYAIKNLILISFSRLREFVKTHQRVQDVFVSIIYFVIIMVIFVPLSSIVVVLVESDSARFFSELRYFFGTGTIDDTVLHFFRKLLP